MTFKDNYRRGPFSWGLAEPSSDFRLARKKSLIPHIIARAARPAAFCEVGFFRSCPDRGVDHCRSADLITHGSASLKQVELSGPLYAWTVRPEPPARAQVRDHPVLDLGLPVSHGASDLGVGRPNAVRPHFG